MSRTRVDWRSASTSSYKNFCIEHPHIKISIDEWRNIIYSFNEAVRDHILETGDKVRLPFGFGDFSINKYRPKKFKEINGKMKINLPVNWKKSKEKGKKVYYLLHETDGFIFTWMWFKRSSQLRFKDLWRFKPNRTTTRLIPHYLRADKKYQDIYKEWKV